MPYSRTYNVTAVGPYIQFSDHGGYLSINDAISFELLSNDGETLATLQLADPISPQDAVTKEYMDKALSHIQEQTTQNHKDDLSLYATTSDLNLKVSEEASQRQAGDNDLLLKINNLQKELDKTNSDIIPADEIEEASPLSLGDIDAMERYGVTSKDVKKFLQQSSEQKVFGQNYASKYGVTPQNFSLDSDGTFYLGEYGGQRTSDSSMHFSSSQFEFPVLTDSTYTFFNKVEGIYYKIDQFIKNSQEKAGRLDSPDGPMVSVSLDGLKWTCIGPLSTTGRKFSCYYDRDNKLGAGFNVLVLTDKNGTMIAQSLFQAPDHITEFTINGANVVVSSNDDHKLYWNDSIKKWVVISSDGNNANLSISEDQTLAKFDNKFTISGINDLKISNPSMVTMKDASTGNIEQVIGATFTSNETLVKTSLALSTMTYDDSKISSNVGWRIVEFGRVSQGAIIVDPLLQDGTSGTQSFADHVELHSGVYSSYNDINSALPSPAFGFVGGQWMPSKMILDNGIPKFQTNDVFDARMTGTKFTKIFTENDVTLPITRKKHTWKGTLSVSSNDFASSSDVSVVRFDFGTCHVDYVFNNNVVDFVPSDCSNPVVKNGRYQSSSDTDFTYNSADSSTFRNMPITRDYVKNSSLNFAWEYDNGRIRLYNENTGDIMSEQFFPNFSALIAVTLHGKIISENPEIIVAQDGGFAL